MSATYELRITTISVSGYGASNVERRGVKNLQQSENIRTHNMPTSANTQQQKNSQWSATTTADLEKSVSFRLCD